MGIRNGRRCPGEKWRVAVGSDWVWVEGSPELDKVPETHNVLD